MAISAFDNQRVALINLHKDIDRLTGLTKTLMASRAHAGLKDPVESARKIYRQLQGRREEALLSPEEESVIEVKMNRLRSQLQFLGARI